MAFWKSGKASRKDFRASMRRLNFQLENMQQQQQERMDEIRGLTQQVRKRQGLGQPVQDLIRRITVLTGEALRARRSCAKSEQMVRNMRLLQTHIDTADAMLTTQEGLKAGEAVLKSMGLESAARDTAKSIENLSRQGVHAEGLLDSLANDQWDLLGDQREVDDDETLMRQLEAEFALDLHAFLPSPSRLPPVMEAAPASAVEQNVNKKNKAPGAAP